MRLSSEQGQTTTEYAVVIALITLGVVLAIGTLSGTFVGILDSVRAVLA